jgi:hypothetical protein
VSQQLAMAATNNQWNSLVGISHTGNLPAPDL